MTDHAIQRLSEPIDLAARRQVIEARKTVLMQRLDDGYQRIDGALGDGGNLATWEEFWIQLLDEYESVCDALEKAA
ncbi:MAG: hypothetical protein M3354_03820 [Chloroflexota bacterium]|nr:hypothetical protein [Chloroflexota bacterium]